MTKPNKAAVARRRFLAGLAELTKTYGVKVAGCGCCGSPYLTEPGSGDTLDDLKWCATCQRYTTGDARCC